MSKLNKKIILRGQIEALTGIAIGGTNSAMAIGGVDKSVIRNQATLEPYIPGSSLKGKMRSLLELSYGTVGDEPMGAVKNGPNLNYTNRSTKLFGNAVKRQDEVQRPSRLIVRDANLSATQKTPDFFKNTDLLYTEVKTEVVIDRITSRAMPRQMERVPAGTLFDFELVLNVYQEDNENDLIKDMYAAIQLVQNDYVGGSGSRGSGQIRFNIVSATERKAAFYRFEENTAETDLTESHSKYFPQ